MALIVENGSGLANAEAYRSVADHKAYCDAMGFSYAGKSDPQLEQAARRATAAMTQRYRMRWAGQRVSLAQALDWPRALVPVKDAPTGYGAGEVYYPSNVVPREVGDAQSELMLRLGAGVELIPDQTRAILSETVGPISTTYDKNTPVAPRFTAIDLALAPLLKRGGSATVVGVVRC